MGKRKRSISVTLEEETPLKQMKVNIIHEVSHNLSPALPPLHPGLKLHWVTESGSESPGE